MKPENNNGITVNSTGYDSRALVKNSQSASAGGGAGAAARSRPTVDGAAYEVRVPSASTLLSFLVNDFEPPPSVSVPLLPVLSSD